MSLVSMNLGIVERGITIRLVESENSRSDASLIAESQIVLIYKRWNNQDGIGTVVTNFLCELAVSSFAYSIQELRLALCRIFRYLLAITREIGRRHILRTRLKTPSLRQLILLRCGGLRGAVQDFIEALRRADVRQIFETGSEVAADGP